MKKLSATILSASNVILILSTATLFTGCAMTKEEFRAEIADSRAYVARTCGADQACRQQLAQTEAYRIDTMLREQEARRERIAAAGRQWSANQAQIAAANAARRPVSVNCQTFGSNTTCQGW